MASGIYAIAHIGHLKLYIGDASHIHSIWPPLLAQLNSGTYPNAVLQAVWNTEGNKRYLSFHTQQELAAHPEIVRIEQLALDVKSV